MTLREAGLPLGIREPYKGSGIVTHASGAQLGVRRL